MQSVFIKCRTSDVAEAVSVLAWKTKEMVTSTASVLLSADVELACVVVSDRFSGNT